MAGGRAGKELSECKNVNEEEEEEEEYSMHAANLTQKSSLENTLAGNWVRLIERMINNTLLV